MNEINETIRWATAKPERIARYEAKGRMPETCAKKLPLQMMLSAAKKVRDFPDDPQSELWLRSIELAYRQLDK